MSSLRLYAPPCCCWASRSSFARRWAMVFSRRWRGGPDGHTSAGVAGELDQPGEGQGARAARGDLDRHLVGRASDAAGANLEDGGERLDRRLERLDGVLARALAEDG